MTGPIVPRPTAGNTEQANCGRIAALAQGGETSRMTRMINDYVSEKSYNRIQDLTGGKLGALGDSIHSIINDNSDFIQNIKRARLYQEWQQSITDIDKARVKAIVAARNTLTPSQFNSYLNDEIAIDLSGIVNEIGIFYNDISLNFRNLSSIYNDISGAKNILTNLTEMKNKVLVDKISKINQYEKEYNVDVRKNLYEYERIELYNNIFNTIKIIYYALFVAYIIFGNFMKLKIYKNVNFYFIAIVYLLFPFTLKYIFAGIIYLYETILNFFGVHKKIYSYNDIIRASNLETIFTAPVPSILDQNNIQNGYNTFVRNERYSNDPIVQKFIT